MNSAIDRPMPNYDEGLKLLRRGEQHLKAQHLKHYSLKDNIINGKVQASMRPEIWSVQVRSLFSKFRYNCIGVTILTTYEYLYLSVINIQMNKKKIKTFSNFQIELSDGRKIRRSKCSCPAGAGEETGAGGKCSHVAALLLYVQKNVSCTDLPCQWSSKKKLETVTQSKTSFLFSK